MKKYIINNSDILWDVLRAYVVIYKTCNHSLKILDKPFYASMHIWLKKEYKITNNVYDDGFFEFKSLEDLTEFKLRWL